MKIFLYSSHDMQSSHSSFLHFPVKMSVYWQYILYCKYLPNLSDGGSGADDSFAAGGGGGADIASGLSLAGAANISFLIYWIKVKGGQIKRNGCGKSEAITQLPYCF